jgi:hypothetical protein
MLLLMEGKEILLRMSRTGNMKGKNRLCLCRVSAPSM